MAGTVLVSISAAIATGTARVLYVASARNDVSDVSALKNVGNAGSVLRIVAIRRSCGCS